MNKSMFFVGGLIFFLFFSSVYSYDTTCCGHQYKQDMAVADFFIGIPSCTGSNWATFLSAPIKFTALIMSVYWMIGSMAGWGGYLE
jgi:hypothetical protein